MVVGNKNPSGQIIGFATLRNETFGESLFFYEITNGGRPIPDRVEGREGSPTAGTRRPWAAECGRRTGPRPLSGCPRRGPWDPLGTHGGGRERGSGGRAGIGPTGVKEVAGT